MRHQPNTDMSIHPRVSYPGGRKKNTARPHADRMGGAGGKTYRKTLKRLMARVKAWEAMPPADRVGRRRPGSMKP